MNFNFYRNSNKHKSLCGGLLSIVFLIGLVYFGLTKFVHMINLDNITNGSNIQEVNPMKLSIPDLSQHFMFFIIPVYQGNYAKNKTFEGWQNKWEV